ncbi:MAG: hypothetical protein JSV33_03010 [bacterium]|nr:MAG: hypothetical protein JSV33_03010 [bacterium]
MCKVCKHLIITFIILFPVLIWSQTAEKSVWQPFDYFVGTWVGHETGRPGIGKGERTYEYIMDGRYLYFRNISKFEPQEKNPEGEVHEDWTFYSYDSNRDIIVMRQFNIEGFVNRFTLDSLSTDNKVFVFVSESSENAPPGLRARMTYTIRDDDEFEEVFELAFPGGTYSVYLKNFWKRKGE